MMTIDTSFIHCAFSLISKIFFTKVLLALQKKKKKGSWQTTTCMPNLGPLTAFVNKVLLRQPHPFICLLSVAAFELTRVELNRCYKTSGPQNLKYLLIWLFTGKLSLPFGQNIIFKC